MRVLEVDPKRRVLKLRLEFEEDLWTLRFTLKPGDNIVCWTTRDVSVGQTKERKPMIVKLRVEKVDFQPYTGSLRVSGVIVEGPDDYGVLGRHHTASLKPGDIIIIERESGWSDRDLKRISESGYKGSALLVAVDYDEYAIALLTSLGVKILEEGYSRIPGKGDEKREEAIEKYIRDVIDKIMDRIAKINIDVIVVGGPGPLKEEISGRLRERAPGKRIHLDEVVSGGISGVHELLRRASMLRALREFAVIEAEEALEEFMSLISNDPERVAYGISDVLACARAGALDKIVIVDSILSSIDERERAMAEKLLEEAEKKRAKIIIVPRESPPGERIYMLGGVIGKLRFKLSLDARRELELE